MLGKIRRQHLKERLKISKIAKFESDLVKAGDDITPQSSKILQTFVWWVAQTCLNIFTDVKVVFPVLLTGH